MANLRLRSDLIRSDYNSFTKMIAKMFSKWKVKVGKTTTQMANLRLRSDLKRSIPFIHKDDNKNIFKMKSKTRRNSLWNGQLRLRKGLIRSNFNSFDTKKLHLLNVFDWPI